MNDPMELHEAAAKGDRNLLERLLLKGHYDIDSEDWTWDMKTPLHVAAQLGNTACLKLLLGYGADGGRKIAGGRTAAHLAAEGGHKSCLAALSRYGVALDTKDDCGITPLDLAELYGKSDCKSIIVEMTKKLSHES